MNEQASIANTAVPALARGHRLQFEPAQDCYVLLYPEGMVTLNEPASEILMRCDGQRSVAEIGADIAAAFDGADIGDDIHDFLRLAVAHGWVVL